MTKSCVWVAVLVATALGATACSDGATRLSPSGPTPVTANVTASEDGEAAITADRSVDAGAAVMVAEWANTRGWRAKAGFAVEGTDVITAVSGTCPSKTITVKGVPVLLNAATTYTSPLSCAALAINQTVRVSATIEVDAVGAFTVTATNIAPATAGPGPSEEEVTGVVAFSTGECPALTINLGAAGVVVTSASTVFTPLGSCGTIAAGKTVKARGTRNASAQLVATSLKIVDTTAPPTSPTRVQGVVAGKTGVCPAVTITLQGSTEVIVTNASTVFDPATLCASLAAGAKVKAVGTRDATGQLVATNVAIDDDDDGGTGPGGKRPKGSGEGVVGSVTGACPTLTLVIQGVRVRTSAATVYVGGGCASLREGTQVKVDAEQQPDGSYLAENIEFRKIPGRPISGDGLVEGVTGTCPSITMTVKGYPVITGPTTVFSGGACSDVARGTKIDVTGEFDGTSVVASAVKIEKSGNGNGGGNGKK